MKRAEIEVGMTVIWHFNRATVKSLHARNIHMSEGEADRILIELPNGSEMYIKPRDLSRGKD